MSEKIVKSCGYCGRPLDAKGNDVDEIPEGYDPDKYEHEICISCGTGLMEQENERMRITHEMAMDAQDPSMEGQLW